MSTIFTSSQEDLLVSLISRLRAVVAGDDYLDNDFDELDYETGDRYESDNMNSRGMGGELAPVGQSNPFDFDHNNSGSKVIGMPGISTANSEVNLMEPRSFDEMPRAIQALRERKTVILNLTMMEPDQAQRAVDFVAGGTFAIDGHQERVGESIFLFAPSCVTVTNSFQEEASPSTVVQKDSEPVNQDVTPAPTPAWDDSISTAAAL
tara:strand:+ start:111 stop:731 length:621 start_codon:yes stop_codon:yes gene_type:complete